MHKNSVYYTSCHYICKQQWKKLQLHILVVNEIHSSQYSGMLGNHHCLIQSGHHLLIKLPNGTFRSMTLEADSWVYQLTRNWAQVFLVRMISLGKYGRFETNSLIGQRYGLQYEITDQLVVMLRPKTIQEIGPTICYPIKNNRRWMVTQDLPMRRTKWFTMTDLYNYWQSLILKRWRSQACMPRFASCKSFL